MSNSLDKQKLYDDIVSELSAVMDRDWFTNLANVSAVLMERLPSINWVGFYLLEQNELYLGPFQGRAACLRIPLGKGVCGTAAQRREPILVDDVDSFPGHIACDGRSRSEIVIPLLHGHRCVGVLDVDAPIVSRFDEDDQKGLERVVAVLLTATTWPASFTKSV